MAKGRSDLGFGEELANFKTEDWKPSPTKAKQARPSPPESKAAAQAAGFKSREPGQGTTVRRRRRRTGRNQQFNIKSTPAAINEFIAIADAMDWGLGETLEKAIPLLRREFLGKDTSDDR